MHIRFGWSTKFWGIGQGVLALMTFVTSLYLGEWATAIWSGLFIFAQSQAYYWESEARGSAEVLHRIHNDIMKPMMEKIKENENGKNS